jgi:hypothetical protein
VAFFGQGFAVRDVERRWRWTEDWSTYQGIDEMKKLLIAGAALGCVAVPTVAMAQTSVTLYGLIDEGLNYTNNTGGH